MSVGIDINMEGFVETKIYGLIMESVNDEDIPEVYRYCDDYDLAPSLMIFDPATQMRILNCMPEEDAEMRKKDLEYRGPLRLEEINDSIHGILPVILLTIKKSGIQLNNRFANELVDSLDISIDQDELMLRDCNYRNVLETVNIWREAHGLPAVKDETASDIMSDREILAAKGLIWQTEDFGEVGLDGEEQYYTVGIKPSDVGYPQISLLAMILSNADDRGIQLCLSHHDTDTLANVLTYMSDEIRAFALENVSKRMRGEIETKLGKEVTPDEAKDSALDMFPRIVDCQEYLYGISYLVPMIQMYIQCREDDVEYGQKVCEKALSYAQKMRDICRYPILRDMNPYYDEVYDVDIDQLGEF